jgi:4-amino-4-deoxy-L-arabinose transferase-like glycosyltransferase
VLWANVLFGALTAASTYLLGRRPLGEEAALSGGAAFAFCPASVAAVPVVWGQAAFALAATGAYAAALGLRREPTVRRAAAFGAVTGLVSLIDTPLLPYLPVAVLAAVLPEARWAWKERCAVALASFLVVVSPWLLRNAIVGAPLVPLRGNFGMELWIGNHPGALEERGLAKAPSHHPSTSAAEAGLVTSLGERRYQAHCLERATAWIRSHPEEFAELTARRFLDYWVGPYGVEGRARVLWEAFGVDVGKILLQGAPLFVALAGLVIALRRRAPVGVLAWAFVTVPLPYLVTHADNPRYRHPLDPLVFLLAGVALAAAWSRVSRRTRGDASGERHRSAS